MMVNAVRLIVGGIFIWIIENVGLGPFSKRISCMIFFFALFRTFQISNVIVELFSNRLSMGSHSFEGLIKQITQVAGQGHMALNFR